MMLSKQADMWVESVTAKDVQNAKDKGLSTFTRQSMVNFMCPDSTNPASPFAKKSVREAVEYAIDKETLNKTFTLGYGEALYQLAPSGTIPYNADFKKRLYDPAKAKQLLAEADTRTGLKPR